MTKRLPVLALLVGCSSAEMAFDATLDTASSGGAAPGTLRIDVYPPSGLGSPQLLPQSAIVRAADYEDVALELAPTVTFSGTLSSEVARGWASVGVPTTIEPLEATLTATVDGTPLGASVQSDADGAFSLDLAAYPDGEYDLAIVPFDAEASPFHHEARYFYEDEVLDSTYALGIPIYGRVTADGVGVANVPLHVERTDVGIESATITTDASGWYVARVEEAGTYVLEVEGGPISGGARVVPTLATEVLVEDTDGVTVFVDLGELGDVDAQGTVVDAADEPVPNAVVRLRSTSLDGASGTVELETETNDDGAFIKPVLAGTYDIDVIPPYEVGGTPRTFEGVRIDGDDEDLGTMALAANAVFSGTVLPPAGDEGVGDVQVVATQVGFDHFSYEARTDEEGNFSFEVPDVEYTLLFTPPSVSVRGATTRREAAPSQGERFRLEEGDIVSGAVTYEEEPAAWAFLEIYDYNTGELVGRGATNEAGNFSMRVHVPAGDTETGTGR